MTPDRQPMPADELAELTGMTSSADAGWDGRVGRPSRASPVLQAVAERGSVQHMRRDGAWTPDPTSDIPTASDTGPARPEELPAARSRGGRDR